MSKKKADYGWLNDVAIRESADCVVTLLNANPFQPDVSGHIITAFVTKMLICVHDLLQKMSNEQNRLSWHDDVKEEGRDITDLISDCRNAACHMGSSVKVSGNTAISFNFIFGKAVGFHTSAGPLSCDYEDDVGIVIGHHVLLARRHLVRAFDEAIAYYQATGRL